MLSETGKSVLQHTYESASASRKATRVIVAADDDEIAKEVRSFGGEVIMTRPDHICGTDRVAEVAQSLDAEIIINVQGDEPEISFEAIDLAISMLEENPHAPMATLATPIRSSELLEDSSCVKVVVSNHGQAMYFSRSVIPHPREWNESLLAADPPNFFQHVGLYGYRRGFLLEIPGLPVSQLEKIESLEQLRVLFNGNTILVGMIDHPIVGIDTPEDYASFVRRQSS